MFLSAVRKALALGYSFETLRHFNHLRNGMWLPAENYVYVKAEMIKSQFVL